jgi:hypothetical protein
LEEGVSGHSQSSMRLRSDTAADMIAARELDSVLTPADLRWDYEGADWRPPDLASSFPPFSGQSSVALLGKMQALSGVSSAVAQVASDLPPLDEAQSVPSCSDAPFRGSSPCRYLDAFENLVGGDLPRLLSPPRGTSALLPNQPDAGLAQGLCVMEASDAETSPR